MPEARSAAEEARATLQTKLESADAKGKKALELARGGNEHAVFRMQRTAANDSEVQRARAERDELRHSLTTGRNSHPAGKGRGAFASVPSRGVEGLRGALVQGDDRAQVRALGVPADPATREVAVE